jgi:hypothetical protein
MKFWKSKIIFIFAVLTSTLCTSKENRNALNSNESRLNGVGCKPFGGWANLCNMEEIWKEIDGYNGIYLISNTGIIKSKGRKWRKIGEYRIMKQCHSSGYKGVMLSLNGKMTFKKVHRLLAIAFIPNPENKPHINHLNGVRDDNRIENLEWCTHSENMQHAYDYGLKKPVKQLKSHLSPHSKAVCKTDYNGNIIESFYCLNDIKRKYGYDPTLISKCCKGMVSKCYGFKWMYKT